MITGLKHTGHKAVIFFAVACVLMFGVLITDASAEEKSGTVKIAVFPWKVNGEQSLSYLEAALSDMLSSRVGSADGVEIMRGDLLRDVLAGREASTLTEAEAFEAGTKLGADYVLFGSLSVIGEVVSLDAKLFDIENKKTEHSFSTARGLDSVVGLVGGLSQKVLYVTKGVPVGSNETLTAGVGGATGAVGAAAGAAATYTGRFAKSAPQVAAAGVGPGFDAGAFDDDEATDDEDDDDDGFIIKKRRNGKKKKRFTWTAALGKETVLAIETADLDGDGAKEVLILTETEVRITHAGPKGLEKLKTIKNKPGVINISLSAFEGKVYVSRFNGSNPDSCILEHTGAGYAFSMCGLSYFMRAVSVDGQTPVLLGQEFRGEWGFKKDVVILKLDKNSGVVSTGVLDLPRHVNLYGFEIFDLEEEGQASLVMIDKKRRLRVYKKKGNGWERQWKSKDYYGGTLNTIEIGSNEEDSGDLKKSVYIEGRFRYADLDNDGANEIIIKSNVAGGVFGQRSERVMSFESGTIKAMYWDGILFEDSWATKDIEGYLSDFILEDIDGDGRDELLIVVVSSEGMFSSDVKSSLVSYTFSKN